MADEEAPTRFDAAYFEQLYRADADPWNFRKSWYERRKYAATIRALKRRRYGRVLEVGCSIGVLSRMLARRTDALVAIDMSATAIASAKARNADISHIAWIDAGFLEAVLDGPFDLIVFSEVLYYLTPGDLIEASARTRALLAPGGEVLIVSWLGKGHHPLSGDEATECFTAGLGREFNLLHQVRKRRYRMDSLQRLASQAPTP